MQRTFGATVLALVLLAAPATAQSVAVTCSSNAGALAFSSDGTTLATAGVDQDIVLWSVADGSVRRAIAPPGRRVWNVAWRPDGAQLVSHGHDGWLRAWDPATGQPGWAVRPHQAGSKNPIAYTPDGRRLITLGPDPGGSRFYARTVDARDGAGGEKRVDLASSEKPAAISPDGSLVARADGAIELIGLRDGKVKVKLPTQWDLPGGLVQTLATPQSLCFTGDGERVLAAVGHLVFVFDAGGKKPPRQIEVHEWREGQPYVFLRVAAAPDGKRFVAGGTGGRVRVFDATTGRALGEGWPSEDLVALAFSPDGARVAWAEVGGRVRIEPAPGAKKRR